MPRGGERSTSVSFDYIIIGAGTAGCLLANRLSRNPAHNVLLIEAGGKDNYHWIHIPVGYLYCIGNKRTDWLYQTQEEPGLNGRQLRYPRGKVLGGSSSINGMIYMRGQARDYDEWARLTGDENWNWHHCLPFFKVHEDHYRLSEDQALPIAFSDTHGSGGEWRVEKQRLHWDILEAFKQAAMEAGCQARDDFNDGDNEGVGYFEVNQKKGWRLNTARAFLKPITHRQNLVIWTKTEVEKLLFKLDHSGKRRCIGVSTKQRCHPQKILAKREVILCAGAIGSPHLLQLSGIGPWELLQKHGINVVQDLPGVGENLQDHLQIRAIFKLQNTKTLNRLTSSLWGKVKIGLEYALKRSGPMSMAPSQLGAFTRSDATQPYANLEYHVQPLSLDSFGEPLHHFDAFTVSVCNLNPTSVGTVRLASPLVNVAPLIAPHYLETEQDRQIAVQSLRQLRQIVAQPALKPFQPQEWKPGVNFQTDEELAIQAGCIANTIFHPVGTTKMGRDDDPQAVVDSRLRLRGINGLRIVDAGIMPKIVSGNTNAPVLMIAEKAAEWIINDIEK